ncbi:hypothetical protein MES5069_430028 [Mesorhizobium escarrei]|uniref:LysR substrate-binding domain-containing protein n=1 Tax=Mesorhizobium escarrei TaxID=666018 RepID=A0ABM9E663_9HYPH|nr:hypothetical protein MES5069_430028 [Mesorhizobium escarrei]
MEGLIEGLADSEHSDCHRIRILDDRQHNVWMAPRQVMIAMRPIKHAFHPRRIPLASPLHASENQLDDTSYDALLVGNVVVDGHRIHAELGGQAPHTQPLKSLTLDRSQGSFKDPLSSELGIRRPWAAETCLRLSSLLDHRTLHNPTM